jgi:hypothetical protein
VTIGSGGVNVSGRRKKIQRRALFWLLLGLGCWAGRECAQAVVLGSSTENLDGTFTYAYTLDNTAGTFAINAWSLELAFVPDWDPVDVAAGGDVDVPNAEWAAGLGIPLLGVAAQDFLNFFGELPAGARLGSFSFVSAFAPGPLMYFAFGPQGNVAQGSTVGPAQARAVPASASSLASVLAAAVWGWAMFRPPRLCRRDPSARGR